MLTSPTWRLSRKDRRDTGRTEEQRALGLQVFRERVYFPQRNEVLQDLDRGHRWAGNRLPAP